MSLNPRRWPCAALPWLVDEARCELDGASAKRLVLGEPADEGEAEILVWRAAEAAQVFVGAAPDGVPVEQVTRAVEDLGDVARAESAALYDGVDGLEHVWLSELEGARDGECGDGLGVGQGEVDEVVLGVCGERVGVCVHVVGNVAAHHAPCL